jgi:hypothetical protein
MGRALLFGFYGDLIELQLSVYCGSCGSFVSV